MLLLLFTIGDNQYGIEATQVLEVWPLLPLKPIHQTPDYIAGLAKCRKQLVPIIDISTLYTNKPASNKISTRIILVKIVDSSGTEQKIGIVAEHVTDTIQITKKPAASIGIKSKTGSLVGQEMLIDGQIIQKINVDTLLPDSLYDKIFLHDSEHSG